MFKQLVLILALAFMAKAQAQTKTASGSLEGEVAGIVEIANLKCMDEACMPEGRTFILPITLDIESDLEDIDVANAEIYLAGVLKQVFNEKLRAMDYKGGLRIFGVQTESLGINTNETRLLSINVVRSEYVDYMDLSKDGKTRLIFNIYGSIGVAKMQSRFNEFGQDGQDLIYDEFGNTLADDRMNNAFGSKIDVGASVAIEMNKIQITGYTRAMVHKSNNFFGGKKDANGMLSQTSYQTLQLGIDLQYNIYSGNRGDLYLFSTLEYDTYNSAMHASDGSDISLGARPPMTKELNFQVGLRYTLPKFRRRR